MTKLFSWTEAAGWAQGALFGNRQDYELENKSSHLVLNGLDACDFIEVNVEEDLEKSLEPKVTILGKEGKLNLNLFEDFSGESEKLSDSDRESISDKLQGYTESQQESAFKALERAYTGIKLERILGSGSYSEAVLFCFEEAGEEKEKVLKLANIAKASAKIKTSSYALTEERVGGEWFALLNFGDNVLKTEKALVYDNNLKKFRLFSTKEVQALINDPALRNGKNLYLVGTISEYIEGSETLQNRIIHEGLSIAEVQNFGRQIFKGIAAIHRESKDSESLIHRDIKPGNILITGDGRAKIFDFGFARFASQQQKRMSCAGSPVYMAPELYKRDEYNGKVDSYALGVTLFEMITGSIPFSEPSEYYSYIYSNKGLGDHRSDALAHIDPVLSDLIGQLGQRNPDARPSVEEALNHPFFSKKFPS